MLGAALIVSLSGIAGTHAYAWRYATSRRRELEAVCADHDEDSLTPGGRAVAVATECALSLLLPFMGLLGPRSRREGDPTAQAPVVVLHPRWARGMAWPLVRHLTAAGWSTIGVAATDSMLTAALDGVERATNRARSDAGSATVDIVALGSAGLVGRIFASRPTAPVRRLVTIATPHFGTHAPWPFGGADLVPTGHLIREAAATGQGRADVGCITVYSTDDPALLPATNAYLPGALAVEVRGLGHLATFASPRVHELVTEALADRSAAAVSVAS